MTSTGRPGSALTSSSSAGHQSANLGDILERVLDQGLVIAGDIQVNLLDIELLTIKLRLVVASLESFHYADAAAIAVVMLLMSFSLLIAINVLERWTKRHGYV